MSERNVHSCRKFDEIYDAVAAARAGDLELAVTHLEKAQEDVNTVVSIHPQRIICKVLITFV